VPHLRDGLIVDKVGHRAKRDPFCSFPSGKRTGGVSPFRKQLIQKTLSLHQIIFGPFPPKNRMSSPKTT
jgi:hypothetical protein